MIERGEDEGRIADLESEVAHLRQALKSRALIDHAIGVVITIGGLPPEDGLEVLKYISQHTNIKLREVADDLVRWPSTRHLTRPVRLALPHAIEHARRMRRHRARMAEGGDLRNAPQ